MVGCLRHWGRAKHCNSWSLFPRRVTTSWWEGNKKHEGKTGSSSRAPFSGLTGQAACLLPLFWVLPPAVSSISQKLIQLQIHWWAYSSHDPGISEKCYTNPNYNRALCHVFKYFVLNGLYAPVLYLFYICFEENLRFIFDVISFIFCSSTNPCFTSDKKLSILGALERWLSG